MAYPADNKSSLSSFSPKTVSYKVFISPEEGHTMLETANSHDPTKQALTAALMVQANQPPFFSEPVSSFDNSTIQGNC